RTPTAKPTRNKLSSKGRQTSKYPQAHSPLRLALSSVRKVQIRRVRRVQHLRRVSTQTCRTGREDRHSPVIINAQPGAVVPAALRPRRAAEAVLDAANYKR